MRVVPNAVGAISSPTNLVLNDGAGISLAVSGLVQRQWSTPQTIALQVDCASGLTIANPYVLQGTDGLPSFIELDAEIT